MSDATQESKSGSNTGKLVVRIVIFAVLAVALILAFIDFNTKNSAVKTAEAWRASLTEANDKGEELTQGDLDKLTQGNPSVADASAATGLTAKTFTWSRTLGDDYQIQVEYEKAVKPSVATIEALW